MFRRKQITQLPLSKPMIYAVTFLFTLHFTPALYINSNFLEQFIQTDNVGYIFTISSILTIIGFITVRPILTKIGNYNLFITLLYVELIALGFMSAPLSMFPSYVFLTAVIVAFITQALILFQLDIFLENITEDSETGSIRGAFLSAQSIATMAGPLIAGLLLTDHDFWKIYSFGIVLLLPTIFIARSFFKRFHDPVYEKPELRIAIRKIMHNKDLYCAFLIQMLLQGFYAWMVIFTPIFLHQVVGFTLSETTFIIGIALIPFIVLQQPLGKIADKWLGEQEMLVLGFIIMAGATATMGFMNTDSFWMWASILFLTRVGASMVEIMDETYFFKLVNSAEVNLMGAFRMLRPVAYIIFPTTASLLLIMIEMKFLFVILGVILLYGIRYSLILRDTK